MLSSWRNINYLGWRHLSSSATTANATSITKRYTAEHEWVEELGEGRLRVGITDYAQRALGDLVYVELSPVGTTLRRGDPLGIVESVKGASDVYAPVSGVVHAHNSAVISKPSLINKQPEQEGTHAAKVDVSNLPRLAL